MLRPLRWAEEEVSSESLVQPLQSLIELIKGHLDFNHDGMITRKELKMRQMRQVVPLAEEVPAKEAAEKTQAHHSSP